MPIGSPSPLLLDWMTGTGVPGGGMSGLPGQAVVLRMQRPPPLHGHGRHFRRSEGSRVDRGVGQARVCPLNRATSSFFRTFPVEPVGSSSTMCTALGYL